MPRAARTVIVGYPHHITHRGNNRQDVFFVDDDRRVYLELLREQSAKFSLAINGYCLMPNHIHLIATPRHETALASAIGRTHWLYTQYINDLHSRSGHLWQNRFFSCALDDQRWWTALCYVERNPVRARLVHEAWRYPWSSAAVHCGLAHSSLLDTDAWAKRMSGVNWKEALSAEQLDEELTTLRSATHTGRPLGSDAWLSGLETALGRRLRPLPIGRPRRK